MDYSLRQLSPGKNFDSALCLASLTSSTATVAAIMKILSKSALFLRVVPALQAPNLTS